MERLFVGVAISDEVRQGLVDHLAGTVGERGLPGRAVPPASWHLTLRFLGDTDPKDAERLRAELRAAPLAVAFEMGFGQMGAFPRAARASVVWVGVESGACALRALAAEVERAAVRAGFAAEPRPFAPHLTLSRVQPPRDVSAVLRAIPPFRARMRVDSVVLFRSRLGAGPPRYEAVETFPLR
ncbi:MAG TPA: RNA 2',3'-cyclic phosphodiesterase [Longimicrobiaceae bacterium]|nr:RNA 2',3'-cyclic phosphodiesterase [Longimicrobiaceae bacterium]